jgi:hypothetical protein
MTRRRALYSLELLLLTGCFTSGPSSSGSCSPLPPAGPAQSGDFATDALSPSMSAQAYGGGIHVYADFGDTELSSGDTLTASENGGAPVPLTRESEDAGGGPVHYLAVFPQNDAPADVVIALERTAPGRVSAPRSEVVVPASFTVTSPALSDLAFGDPLPITVSPPPTPVPTATVDAMSITASGPCLDPPQQGLLRVEFDSQGDAAFDTSLIHHQPVSSGGCDVTIEVRHETRGPFDPAFTPPDAGSNAAADANAGEIDAAVLVALEEAGIVWSLTQGGVEGLQSRSFTAHFAR